MPKSNAKLSNNAVRSRVNKLIRMSILCYKNALRLHSDAILLYKRKSYPSANALSIVAIEEMGKYETLSHGLFYHWFDSKSDEEFIVKVLNDTYDHRKKQRGFINQDYLDARYADVKHLEKRGLDFYELFEKFYANEFEPNFSDPEFGKYFPNLKKHYQMIYSLEN